MYLLGRSRLCFGSPTAGAGRRDVESVARLAGWSPVITRLALRQLTGSSLTDNSTIIHGYGKNARGLSPVFEIFFEIFPSVTNPEPPICNGFRKAIMSTCPCVCILVFGDRTFGQSWHAKPFETLVFCLQTLDFRQLTCPRFRVCASFSAEDERFRAPAEKRPPAERAACAWHSVFSPGGGRNARVTRGV